MDCCPVCKGNSEKTFLCKVNLVYGVDHDLVECQNCKAVHYTPVPTDKELGVFYSAGGYEFDRWKQEAKARFFAKKFLKEKKMGRFLDVGCASGYFINGIRQHSKWDVFGIDVGQKPIQFAKEVLGLDVKESDLVSANFSEDYFDFVHINDVLEHVNNPVETLAECHRIIKHDGTLFLSIPNGSIDCLDLIHFYKDKNRPGRQYSGHIYFFPKQTLLNIFEEIGFDVISAGTFHLKNGLRRLG
ncbi:class I SAM-dependent methyltransferase, partial [bacterium]|nr:class I SAM-dependent methyltransferase [bacterium]